MALIRIAGGSERHPLWGQAKPAQRDLLEASADAFWQAERMGIPQSNIIGLWPMWEGAGIATHNLATAGVATHQRVNADTKYVIDPAFGVGFNQGASGGGTSWGFQDAITVSATGFTVRARLRIATTNGKLELAVPNGGLGGTALTTRTAATTAGATLAYSTTKNWTFFADGPGLAKGASAGSSSITTGQFYDVIGVYDGGSFKIYVDGELLGTDNYNIAGSFSGTFDGTIITLGDLPTANTSSGMVFDHVFAFSQGINSDQVARLYETPYFLLEPRPYRYISIPAVGVGVATLRQRIIRRARP